MGNYISTGDIDNFSTGNTSAENNAIIDRVEETVERITKDVFYPKTFHLFLNGNRENQIFPKFTSKILSINKMSISDTEIDTTDFTGGDILGTSGEYSVTITEDGITEDYYQNDYLGIYDASESTDYYWGTRILTNEATDDSGDSIFSIEKPLPMTLTTGDTVSLITNWDWNENSIFRSMPITTHEPGTLMEPEEFFLNGVFPKGNRNIELWGSYGWYECPKQIKQASIILTRYENDNTLYSRQGYGMKSEKLGDYSYSKFDKKKFLTGVIEADELLDRYVRRKPILGVA